MPQPKRPHFTGIRAVGDDMIVVGNEVTGAHTAVDVEGDRATIIANRVVHPEPLTEQSLIAEQPAQRRWYQDLTLQVVAAVLAGIFLLVISVAFIEPWAKAVRPGAASSVAASSPQSK